MKTLVVHLGSHFFVTLAIAIDYYRITRGWLGWLGSALIMFAGCLIDLDHYLGNGARCKQILENAKALRFSFGDPNPNRVNYFHTAWFRNVMLIVSLIMMFLDYSLAIHFFLAYVVHIFVIDILDYENQTLPKNNPLPTKVHYYFWNRYSWFQKICFNKPR